MELDLGAVRAFVAVADGRQFSAAADRLGFSQQAISKRVAKLESDLGAVLLRRSPNGTELTEDGAAFLLHARELLSAADRATELLGRRRRALRIDVIGTRTAPLDLVRDFHERKQAEVEIVTSNGLASARPALVSGSIDAAFARVTGKLEDGITHLPAYLDPAQLLVSRTHRYARRKKITLGELAGVRMWIPGAAKDTEWTEFHHILNAESGIIMDTSGPSFGFDHYVETVGESDHLIGMVCMRSQVPWNPHVVRIPIVDPAPVFPWSLIWHRQNRHPVLPVLIAHVTASYRPYDPAKQWLPPADRAAFTAARPT